MGRAIVLVSLLALVQVPAHGALIVPPAGDMVLWTESGVAQSSYDWATETWAVASPWIGRWFNMYPETGQVNVPDVLGNYYVSARVDHSGNVLGGTFSLVLQSASLGINSPEAFLSGTILGSSASSCCGVGALFAAVDYFNPALANLGPIPDFAILSFIGVPFAPLADSGPFNVWDQEGRIGQPWSLEVIQPDIFGYVKVPEPGGISLFAAGLFALGFVRRRAVA